MKHQRVLGLSLAVLLVTNIGSAQATPLPPGTASPGFSLFVAANESCASFSILTPFPSGPIIFSGPLPCVKATDPISGIKKVPTFTLPIAVTAGDVLVLEPGMPTGRVTDLLRFIPNQPDGSSTQMAFFSDSDVVMPSLLQSNNMTVTEVGTEASNFNVFGFFILTGNSVADYHMTSDLHVPEPASIFLLTTGAGILGLTAWRRRNRLAECAADRA